MSVEITSDGFEDVDHLLKYIKTNLDENTSEILHIFGESVVAEARSNLQNNTNINTGDLLSSIMILDEGNDYIIIGTESDYAGYIEYGRGPVRPLKEGGWLHWIDKSSGKDVFAKFANAIEPMPFLWPSIVKHMLEFPNLYLEWMNKNIASSS